MATTFNVTPIPETTPNSSAASITTEQITWDAGANTLTYDFTIKGLDFGQVTGMHFHVPSGAPGKPDAIAFGQLNPAQDADDFKTIMNADGSWTVHGVWEKTDPASISITDLAPVLSSAPVGSSLPLYWDVHTTMFPNGAARWQLHTTV